MQDNIVYKLELTAEEYEYVENLKKEYYKKLSQMTKRKDCNILEITIVMSKN